MKRYKASIIPIKNFKIVEGFYIQHLDNTYIEHGPFSIKVQKLIKKRGAINKDYTYIVFGKSNAYAQKQDVLLPLMEKSFSKLKK